MNELFCLENPFQKVAKEKETPFNVFKFEYKGEFRKDIPWRYGNLNNMHLRCNLSLCNNAAGSSTRILVVCMWLKMWNRLNVAKSIFSMRLFLSVHVGHSDQHLPSGN